MDNLITLAIKYNNDSSEYAMNIQDIIKNTIITNGPKNIIISNKNDNIEIFDKYSPFIINNIKDITKIFSPSFFRLVILSDKIKTDKKNILQLYNCVLVEGTFIIPKIHFTLFKFLSNPYFEYKNYIIIHKKNNYIFINNFRIADCIICGTQKASTTSALVNLQKHPEISANNDEIHYYDLYWYKGEQYVKNFHDYTKLVIIKNPELMYLSSTHWMINSNPFIKLLIFLRNPISRAYSSWQMVKNNNWTDKTFEECLKEELEYRIGENKIFKTAQWHFLQRGLYYKQIINLLKWFPMQNIKILIIEHFTNDMVKEYNEIYDFLDLKHINDIIYTKERINNYDKNIDTELYNKLINFYKKDVECLEKLLGKKLGWF